MLSIATRSPSIVSATRRIQRAFVLPLVGAVVGFFLVTASAGPIASRFPGAATTVERAPTRIDAAGVLLRVRLAIFDIQRRGDASVSSALPHDSSVFAVHLAGPIRPATGRNAWSARPAAPGYDANAPPRRPI